MKHNILMIISVIMIMTGLQTINAQNKESWKEKMMSEKIAFLTNELNITPEEAQKFWPVYNQVGKEKDEAMHAVFRSFKELSTAIKENRSSKEISALLDKYLEAQQKQRQVDNAVAAKFKKVLPIEKVAKLYVAEEKYRRQQIHRLHSGHHKNSDKSRQENK